MALSMHDFLWQAFVTLLVVINPFAILPIYLGLTRRDSVASRRKTALKACVIGGLILLTFAFLGDYVLDAMSISEPAFRIAGGIIFFLIAIEMVLAKTDSGLRSPTEDEEAEAEIRPDVSIFPLAIPMIGGPGGLTSLVVLMRQAETMSSFMPTALALVLCAVLIVAYLTFFLGDHLMRFLGVTGTNVLTRVFGIILAALAIQNIINGIVAVIERVTG